MTSEARFGITITADGKVAVGAVREVREEVDKLEAAGKRLAASEAAATQARLNANYAAQKAAEQYRAQADSMGSASKEVQKLLDKYDPLGTKLRSLEADFKMLNKAAMGGELGKSSDLAVDKTYRALNQEIARTKELMSAAGAATEGGATSISKLGLNSQYARRELMMLGREALTGDFSQMPRTFSSLVAHSNILPALLNPITLAVVAIGAAAGVMAAAFAAGRKEMEAMNNALSTTGNYAGLTRGQMIAVSESVSKAGTLTVGTAKDIVTQIVASGRYGAENVALLARLTENYAAVTGQSIDKVTPQLIKMFEDPARASETLNQQYHHLSVAELERIRTLEANGQKQQAVTLAIKALDEHLPQHIQNLGFLEAAWIKVTKALSDFWNNAKKIGAERTLDEQIADAQKNIELLTSRSGGLYGNAGVLRSEQDRLAGLQANKAELEELARWAGVLAGIKEREAAAQRIVDQSQTHQLTVVREQAASLANAPDSPDKSRRSLELNRQQLDILRAIDSESHQLSEERLAGELKLYEIQNKGAADQIETQFKLGNITKSAHDAQLLANEISLNAEKQMTVSQQLRYGLLLPAERERLQIELQVLAAEGNAIRQRGDNAVLIERNNLINAQAEADANAMRAVTELYFRTMEGLDKSIEAQKLHNAEIGKTKDQVDLLKAAEIDRTIKELENQASLLASDAGVSEAADAAIARIHAEIGKRKELKGLLTSGAALEANAAATKRESQEFERMFNAVEQTGKQTFNILALGGENMAQRIGKALKSSVADLLYQLTARPFIVQIGTSIAGSLGISTAGTALASGGTTSLLSGGSSILSGVSNFFAGGAGLSAGTVAESGLLAGMDAGLVAAGSSAGAVIGSTFLSTVAAAAPWVAGAYVVGNMLGLFGGDGAPKNPNLGLTRSGAGLSMVTQNDFGDANSLSAAQAQAMNLWLQQLPPRLQAAIDGMVVSLSPGATPQQAWQQIQAQIVSTAGSLNLTTDELTHLKDVATQTAEAAQLASARRQLEIKLMEASGDASGALAAKRADELAAMDATLRPLQDLINAAHDLAAATTAAAAANDATIRTLSDARGAVYDAYDTEAQRLRSLAEAMGGFGKNLRELQSGLLLGANSPLGPMEQLGEAQRQFREVARRSQLGDQEALAALSGASQSYLSAGRAAFASGDAYSSIFGEVQAALGASAATAERTAANTGSQLSLMQSQVEQLIGIRSGVQSLAGAMDAFTDVLRTGSIQGASGTSVGLGAALGRARADIAAGNARAVYDTLIAEHISAAQFDAAMGYSPGTANAWARSQNLPAFAEGTPYVPYDMSARIHRGERITPAASNDALVRAAQATAAGISRLEARIDRLSAIVEAGEAANVQATQGIAENRAAIARRESLERRAQRRVA